MIPLLKYYSKLAFIINVSYNLTKHFNYNKISKNIRPVLDLKPTISV